jgi:hypothetical protein
MLYFPIAIVITTYFTILNSMYIPVAWIKHTLALISTLTSGNETMDEWSERVVRMQTILLFFIFGPIFLILAIPVDSFVFFYNLYTIPREEIEDKDDLITCDELNTFQETCTETLRYERFINGKNEVKTKINFIKINKSLQQKFMIKDRIYDLVYANYSDDKFIWDPALQKTIINPKFLRSIKQFILLKKLVSYCAESNSLVDIELLKSLIDQANLRLEMLMIEMRIGDLDIGKTKEEIFKDILFELFRT